MHWFVAYCAEQGSLSYLAAQLLNNQTFFILSRGLESTRFFQLLYLGRHQASGRLTYAVYNPIVFLDKVDTRLMASVGLLGQLLNMPCLNSPVTQTS
jgi:hypothetical protein